MRPTRHAAIPGSPDQTTARSHTDREILRRVITYLWGYKWRVALALGFMVAAKGANVGVPLVLKDLVDGLTPNPDSPLAVLVVPLALLLAYGLLRFSVSLCTELRELVLVHATQGAARRIALETFSHLHELSLRFHLDRQTGGMTRDIERGIRGLESLISYSLYSVLPTLFEMALVLTILSVKFDLGFAAITMVALVVYIIFTVSVTEWRTRFRRQANEMDSATHTRAIDSLLNYETVKYFNNEQFESDRYGQNLQRLTQARLKSQTSLSLLNLGQQLIISTALVAMLWRAIQGVQQGHMTLGDLVMINAFMIQLYIPLNFLGVLYREIKQSMTDLDRMFNLLETQREVADLPQAAMLNLQGPPAIQFQDVGFSYTPQRQILKAVSFEIPAGRTLAVVGPSGAGKSTLARLLYRFYDVQQGAVQIAGIDIRQLRQDSFRRAIGIVPQDTVLFNDTLAYNIAYGRPQATSAEIEQVVRAARLDSFVAQIPQGLQTPVGERGLKLSGGEKQRVAIARTLLKNPPILILDEATSALDTANERAIQAELEWVARDRTTLVIAHRLSSVIHADQILVLDAGMVVESGRHEELLSKGGRYAQMWWLQNEQTAPKGEH